MKKKRGVGQKAPRGLSSHATRGWASGERSGGIGRCLAPPLSPPPPCTHTPDNNNDNDDRILDAFSAQLCAPFRVSYHFFFCLRTSPLRFPLLTLRILEIIQVRRERTEEISFGENKKTPPGIYK